VEEGHEVDTAGQLHSLKSELIDYRARIAELAYREPAGRWDDTMVAVTWSQALDRSRDEDQLLASALRVAKAGARWDVFTSLFLSCVWLVSVGLFAATGVQGLGVGELLLLSVGCPLALSLQFFKARSSVRWHREQKARLTEECRELLAAARSLARRSRALLASLSCSPTGDEMAVSADWLRAEVAFLDRLLCAGPSSDTNSSHAIEEPPRWSVRE
jgi:hypothetical protein